jgi:hypothetical protein
MNELKPGRGHIGAYALVRDKNGKPRFKDVHNIPVGLWEMLTESEKEELRHVRNARISS